MMPVPQALDRARADSIVTVSTRLFKDPDGTMMMMMMELPESPDYETFRALTATLGGRLSDGAPKP